jgi:hypothetical protein
VIEQCLVDKIPQENGIEKLKSHLEDQVEIFNLNTIVSIAAYLVVDAYKEFLKKII